MDQVVFLGVYNINLTNSLAKKIRRKDHNSYVARLKELSNTSTVIV